MLRQNANRFVDEPKELFAQRKPVNMMNFTEPDVGEEEMKALLKEEKELSAKLADPAVTDPVERRLIRSKLDLNFLRQRDGFYNDIHPRNSAMYKEKYTIKSTDAPGDVAYRYVQHPAVTKIIVPVLVVGIPVFFRFYPKFACWRDIHIKRYSKGQLIRRRFIWRRNVLAEGAAKAFTERVAGRCIVGFSIMLFLYRITDEYLAIVHGKGPDTEDFE